MLHTQPFSQPISQLHILTLDFGGSHERPTWAADGAHQNQGSGCTGCEIGCKNSCVCSIFDM